MPLANPPLTGLARGWTLLEVLIVTAIAALICALALPPFNDLTVRLGADTTRMQMITVFHMARNTAITRSESIAVCPSEDGRACGDDWSRGWLIFRAAGAPVSSPADEDVLRFQPGSPVRGVRAWAGSGRPRLRFLRDGRSAGSTLTVRICAGDALHSRVIVNNVGRTRARRVRAAEPCAP